MRMGGGSKIRGVNKKVGRGVGSIRRGGEVSVMRWVEKRG